MLDSKESTRRADRRSVHHDDAARPAADPEPPAAVDAFRRNAPRITSAIATLIGFATLLNALWEHHWRVLSAVNPFPAEPTGAAATALAATAGLLLLRVAAGLRRGKRSAWWITVVSGTAIVAVDLVRSPHRPVELAVASLLVVGLLTAPGRFTTPDDHRSRWFAVRVGVQFLVVAVAYGTIMLLLPGHVPSGTSVVERLREVLIALVGGNGPVPFTDDGFTDTFHATMLAFGLLTLVTVMLVWLRPSAPAEVLSDADDAGLRTLLARHGDADSLGYFALRRDKSVVWSPSHKAAVTYRVVAGVALVSGDPLGDPEAWPGALAAYRDLVQEHAWTPAVIGCSERGATAFHRDLGLAALVLGDEAVVTTRDFGLDGRAMRGVRQACTRVERAGYTVQVRRVSAIDPDELAALRTAAARWRGDSVERGFSMALSRIGEPLDDECVVVTAHQDGALRGLLHFVPWGATGLSLDLMRRDRNCDNGINEFMIVAALRAGPGLGVERVSLNFAMFRDALERGGQIGAGPVLRLWRRVLLIASRWWQIESLYRFNAKFQPTWQPRFVSYPAARDLPRVALAAAEAEAFVVRPRLVTRLSGRG